MNTLLKFLSVIGLGLTVVPAFLVFSDRLAWETHAMLMIAGTLHWFASAPFWMLTKPSPPRPSPRQ